MEVELDDGDVAEAECVLELIDRRVTRSPNVLRNQFLDPDDENIFVVRPVEDSDHAARRYALVIAPHEVVVGFFGARDLEGPTWQPCGFTPGRRA
jgi:hypothetical protein